MKKIDAVGKNILLKKLDKVKKIDTLEDLNTLTKIYGAVKTIGAIAIIAILAVIAIPLWQKYIEYSHNKSTKHLLAQIALTQMVMQPECGPHPFMGVYTDGLDETAEEAVMKLVKFGFRPDPSVAFNIMRPEAINGVLPSGFVAFAAHNSAGSTIYVYDNIGSNGIVEAHENSEYGGVKFYKAAAVLFCYEYDASNTAAPIEKKPYSG